QRDARQLVLAVERARASGHLAAIAHAGRRRVARQLGKLQRRGEALLHRLVFVGADRLEPRAQPGILLGGLAPPIVLLDRTLLRHWRLLAYPRLRAHALTAGTGS